MKDEIYDCEIGVCSECGFEMDKIENKDKAKRNIVGYDNEDIFFCSTCEILGYWDNENDFVTLQD